MINIFMQGTKLLGQFRNRLPTDRLFSEFNGPKPIFFITIVTYISICHTVDDILTRFKGNKDVNGELVVFRTY